MIIIIIKCDHGPRTKLFRPLEGRQDKQLLRRGFIFTRVRVGMRLGMKIVWKLLKLIINFSHLYPFYSVL